MKGSRLGANYYFGAPAHLRQAQARCDTIQAEFRAEEPRRSIRREPPPRPAARIPTDDELKLRLAEELEYARRILEGMGDELASDMGVVMRHSVALQAIDVVGQMLGHIADITRSSDPAGAVERVGMSDLRSRLIRDRL
ncbi:MAG: hypothetical protein ABIS23_06485 [Sphingomicrobium sp.]